MTQLREAIDRGNAARRAGLIEEALTHYRAAMVAAPDDGEAMSLTGLMLLQLSKIEEADPLLKRAVQRDPEHIGFRINLAALFERQGLLKDAMLTYSAITNLAPGFAPAWERLGDLTMQMQKPGEAIKYLERAAVLEPDNTTVAVKQAAALLALGLTADARRRLDALHRAPPTRAFFDTYVNVATAQADWPAVERAATAWVKAVPSDPGSWQALTTAHYETGRLREAMELYRNVLQYGGRDARRLTVYAQHCLNVSEIDEAETALRDAEILDPAYVEMLSARALLATYRGRFEEAEAYCRRALAQDAGHIAAYRVLSQLKRGRLTVEERSVLSGLAGQRGLKPADRIAASFLLGDAFDAAGAFDEAFAAYSSANRQGFERTAAENAGYIPAKRVQWIDALIAQFASVPSPIVPSMGPRPIFIVGMPRSGTTLTESILARDSRVFACGERTVMPQILLDFLAEAKRGGPAQITGERWQNWVRAYWYQLPDIGGALSITDKNPFNFESAGLIAALFPDAKIVNVRRNPVETGFSIFRNEFSKFVAFSNRLEDIGHYYGQYARLTAHWERVLGERFVTVQYETLAGDHTRAAPALLAACGLAADAEGTARDRPITTLSAVQARGGVSVMEPRADRYKAHIGPLIRALEAAGIDLATGALKG